jgi:hypothetical protein
MISASEEQQGITLLPFVERCNGANHQQVITALDGRSDDADSGGIATKHIAKMTWIDGDWISHRI